MTDAKMLEVINELLTKNIEFEQRIKALETGSKNTGVFFEGVPDYARDYIIAQDTKDTVPNNKKVGE